MTTRTLTSFARTSFARTSFARRLASVGTVATLASACALGIAGCGGSTSTSASSTQVSTDAGSASGTPETSESMPMPSSSAASSTASSPDNASTPAWGHASGAGVTLSEGYVFATGTAMPNPSGGASANATPGGIASAAGTGMAPGGMASGGMGSMSAMSAAYFTITNTTDHPVVLQQVRCTSIACTAQVHTTVTRGGASSMHEVDSITIPAHGHHDLAPGADHVMLTGLRAPLVHGGTLTLTLRFSTGTLTLNLPVVSREQRPHA